MKIGILYICTGKYDVFWNDFYKSAEQFLLPNSDKQYFVFTDSETIQSTDNIHKIYQEKLGWPKDTLMRFHLFLNIEEELKKMDYLFFFNAKYTFIKAISENELLPTEKDNFLTGQLHPVAYHKKRKNFDYETNSKSTAFIQEKAGTYYFAGGLIGGRTSEFLQLCHQLKNCIDIDFSNNIVAKWHDESHINNYFSKKEPKKLHPGYCYPQGWYLPKLGCHSYLRGEGNENNFAFIKDKLFFAKQLVRANLYRIFGYSFI